MKEKILGNVLRVWIDGRSYDFEIISNPLGEEYRYDGRAIIYHYLLEEYEIVENGITIDIVNEREDAFRKVIK